MKLRIALVLLMVVLCVSGFAADNKITVPLPPDPSLIKPLEPFSSHGLAVTFALDKTEFEASTMLKGTYTLKCVGNGGFIIYNPLVNLLTTRPGEVRIFDCSGKLVTELLKFRGGSWLVEEQKVMVYPGDFLGSHVSGWPYNDATRGGMLPEGEYKAQFVLYSYVVLGQERVSQLALEGKSGENSSSSTEVIAASEPQSFKIIGKNASKEPTR